VLEALLEGHRVLTPQVVQEMIPPLHLQVENFVQQVVELVVANHLPLQDLLIRMDLLVDLVVVVVLVDLVA
jgi:DNA-binding MltR family transcriptional regulator